MSKPAPAVSLGDRIVRNWVWLVLCVLAAMMLLAVFQPGPRGRQAAKRVVTEAKLNALAVALNLYLCDSGGFPASLDQLYGPRGTLLGSDHLTPKDLQLDAWKYPIVYSLADNGTATVMSYGADGRPGGEHYDRDLVVQVLPKPAATRPASESSSSQPSTMTGE